jgi:hypothetical protein
MGSLAVGIATWGFFRSFQFLGIRTAIAWLATLALVSSGLADVNACLFHRRQHRRDCCPDSDHEPPDSTIQHHGRS